MDEFSALCQSRPALAGLWRNLSESAHQLVKSKVRTVFFGDETDPEFPFYLVKTELEDACRKAGIEFPDLSLGEFKKWILRY